MDEMKIDASINPYNLDMVVINTDITINPTTVDYGNTTASFQCSHACNPPRTKNGCNTK